LIVCGIPAFNEEKTIAKIVIRASAYVDRVVVVDDGSSDDTSLIAEKLGAKVIKHVENLGYGAAIRSCFNAGKDEGADILVILDADGQHNPDLIPELIKPIANSDADVVIGSRFLGSESDIPPYRRAGLRLLNQATNTISSRRIGDTQSGFRAYSRKAILRLRLYEDGMGASSEASIKSGSAGLKIVEVPASFKYKGTDKSSQNPLSHGFAVLSSVIVIAAEKHPVAIFGFPGMILVLSAIAGLSWVLDRYVRFHAFALGPAIVFTTTLIVGVFAAFVGIVLFAIARVSRRM
jgi:glycosyltransferase involved in cell wall biosynthesis